MAVPRKKEEPEERTPRSNEDSESRATPPPKIQTKTYFVPSKHDYGAWN